MDLKTVISPILLLVIFTTFAQAQESRMRLQVLQHSRVNREHIFNSKDQSKTYLTYLGELITKKGVRYKIMNSVWIWGNAHRATSRILVYNEHNQYWGIIRLQQLMICQATSVTTN
ncbi:hypothetical protein ABZR88_09730 [Mucilaginibacter yixingensis]|uniref:hypothetical protein n=1 Tax=Mucilaginibacter yixingensis TaxID=1295612 RepID=UPI000D2FACB1|nr:hypothetical protein [Mucilaginibacter yixingensis]